MIVGVAVVSASTLLRNGLDVGGRRIVQVVPVSLELDRHVLRKHHEAREPRRVDGERRVGTSAHVQLEA